MCLDYSLVSSNDPNKDLVILTILSVHVVMQHLIPMICTVSFQESFNLQEACHRESDYVILFLILSIADLIMQLSFPS
jgi:hypothetical protein